jgi:hypothetical protein
MLRVDASARKLSRLESTTLSKSKILERETLQTAIVNSWEAFCAEIGLPELYFIGQEIEPHDSCRDRIDILALDGDGTPYVFELKRGRDPLQLLQALSYAAMVSHWDKSQYLNLVAQRADEDGEEIRDRLRSEAFALQPPEVVLVAESFDPEVILTAEWLSKFQLSVTAFRITAVDDASGTLLSVEQRYPLLGLDDVYVARARRPPDDGSTWEAVVKELSFDFAAEAVAEFRKQKEGNPAARRFASMYSESPLGRMTLYLRKKHITAYTFDQSSTAGETLRARLGPSIPVSPWGSERTATSGFTFQIESRAHFEQFVGAVSR